MSLFNTNKNLTPGLPFWDIQDGVMFNHDGSVEVGIELTPPTNTFLDDNRMEELWKQLRTVLRLGTPEHGRTRVYVESSPDNGQTIRDYREIITEHPLVRTMVDSRARHLELRRLQGRVNQWRFVVTCTIPSRKRAKGQSYGEDEFKQALARAREVRGRLKTMLDIAGFKPHAMDDQGVFEFIWRYLNPGLASSKPPKYITPAQRTYYPEVILEEFPDLESVTTRRQLACSEVDNTRPHHLMVGDRFVKTIAMKRIPDETRIGMVESVLTALGGKHFYLVVDYYHEPHGDILRQIQKQARQFNATATDETVGYIDPNVKVGLRETEGVLEHMSLTGQHVFSTGVALVLVAREQEELQYMQERSIAALSSMGGVMPVVGNVQNVTLYLEELMPFGGTRNSFKFKAMEENSADFFPLAGPWVGEKPISVYGNRWGGLTGLNFFSSRSNNYNMLVLGGSGSGKTFFVQSMLKDIIANGGDVMVVDRGWGYKPLMEAIGASIIPLQAGGGVSINPFDLPDGETEPDDEQLGFLNGLIRTMMPGEGGAREAVENAIITEALKRTYRLALSDRPDETGAYKPYYKGARLSDFVGVLMTMDEIGSSKMADFEKETARSLALALRNWTGDTPNGRFVDRETSVRIDNVAMYFETSALEKYPELSTIALLLLGDLIWKRAKARPHVPKIAVFDEAWALLKNPYAQTIIVDLFRRARRYKMSACAVSQSLQDFMNIPGILQSTSYYFVGKLPGETGLVRDLLKLDGKAIEQFESLANQKGEYSEFLAWIRKEDGIEGDIIRLEPSPLEYWTFTTNRDDEFRREEVIKQHGGDLIRALKSLSGLT
ncbi:TraC family protein [Deinococcus soli (ex Cha et al. 2016)]|uniref:Conjugal transfer ATP-binding protein TraC n=2 Tax=Deinococcus soli (ex Cha et al. 2016) TaxID=1309411 RepID=A0AAE3XC08_9DEIO|nr:TraC family protein [Deinococcus soli (ex Cha et al. 2016)]MDR6218516.1 conjugal transfer ATP-binding protein TraC [Deinococcus soli (ex Cha et al. 2016)]MDR6329256.1 conjugal transfer ATP-binding protein TraC [Deinococcus soli (ex Cha et al. 2016)]MDR6751529.1 conjugal transfer ATP-binding protein TraC [Deinococcus soli (ex Cha et al. 2016)]